MNGALVNSPVSPWKPCDLRGIYPAPVSEDLFRRVGAAIGSELAMGQRVVVGGDFRLSTPPLKAALIEGLAATGLLVLDAGQAPTPVVCFEAQRSGAAGVFIVTASHNPGTHNGLKWMTGTYPPTPADIRRVRANAESGVCRAAAGAVERVDPVPIYKEWILSRWSKLPSWRFGRIVLDAGNGAWSHLAPEIFRELGFEVACLYCDPDGRFPNRSPDCARTGNLGALRAAVVSARASLGIAWDGDGDRVAFVDETGVHATTDEISILMLRHVLKDVAPQEHIVYDIKLSDAVRRAVLAAGGRPLLERSGHAFMRRLLLESRSLLGLDACGHYFFREAGSRDDGVYSALFLLSVLDGTQSLAEARRSVERFFSTPELRLPASLLNYDTVLGDGIVLARESSTEAVVSLRIEGFSSAGYARLVDVCLDSLEEGSALCGARSRKQLSSKAGPTAPKQALPFEVASVEPGDEVSTMGG